MFSSHYPLFIHVRQ